MAHDHQQHGLRLAAAFLRFALGDLQQQPIPGGLGDGQPQGGEQRATHQRRVAQRGRNVTGRVIQQVGAIWQMTFGDGDGGDLIWG